MSIIDKPTDYFNTVLWSGDNVDGRAITTGLETNWTWAKRRNATNGFIIADSVRGATYKLDSSTTNAEVNNYDGGHLESFTSTGFTMGVGSGDFGHLNASGGTYVAWNWKAGGIASSNTDGSITSSVSANTDAGFSIVSYTGTANNNETVGHGLGVAPSVVIIKNRSITTNWSVLHTSAGLTGTTLDGSAEYYMLTLNSTGARGNVSEDNIWNPTSTTFKINNSGAGNQVNGNGNSMIAYCFAEKQGFSKFGSYTGNGNADGTFVYTGFKPAWVMWKRTDATNHWLMLDNQRDIDNPVHKFLLANTSDVEVTNNDQDVDFTSNGFKMRNSNGRNNASGGSYIYMAFAKNPFVTSTGVPATAR